MATTRIIPMHINKGKTIAQCLTDRIDYATNPEKTNGGELISSFGCDYHTADAEFLLRKKQYDELKQRNIRNEIIAYQIRQSFKPGEVTPEEANKIGYEFASRLLKGNHAFIVATHVNTNCIHNHIIYSPIRFDLSRKWKDVRRSHKDIARLSDLVCIEHNLSVVTKQQESKIGNAISPVVDLIKSLTGPVLAIVGALGSLYCILLVSWINNPTIIYNWLLPIFCPFIYRLYFKILKILKMLKVIQMEEIKMIKVMQIKMIQISNNQTMIQIQIIQIVLLILLIHFKIIIIIK